jgi:hypothetical protein
VSCLSSLQKAWHFIASTVLPQVSARKISTTGTGLYKLLYSRTKDCMSRHQRFEMSVSHWGLLTMREPSCVSCTIVSAYSCIHRLSGALLNRKRRLGTTSASTTSLYIYNNYSFLNDSDSSIVTTFFLSSAPFHFALSSFCFVDEATAFGVLKLL